MAKPALDHVVRQIHRLVAAEAGPSDGQLLEQFLARKDEAAFAALVERHGAMVLGVARDVLPHVQDAEDVFQAAFLLLARKAGSIRERGSVGSWLHGVARHLALKARDAAAGRRLRESRAGRSPEVDAPDELTWSELRLVLHEELDRLPERLRAPLVLCYLEGMSQDEAAGRLGLSKATVKGRLERGRRLLRARLTRRGLTASAALLAAVWPLEGVAAVPATLAEAAVQAVGAANVPARVLLLAKGTVPATLTSRLVATVVLLLTLGLGVGLLARPREEGHAGPPVAPKDRPRDDRDRIQGTWQVTLANFNGKHQARQTSTNQTWHIGADRIVMLYEDGTDWQFAYQLDLSQKPRAIDLTEVGSRGSGALMKGIYELDGDRLRVHFNRNILPQAERPRKFETDGDRGSTLFALRRIAPARDDRHGDPMPADALARLGTVRFRDNAHLTRVAVAPDGRTVAAVSGTSVRLWAAQGQLLRVLTGHSRFVVHLAFSPDSRALASAGADGVVRVWDVETGAERLRLEGHQKMVASVAFSPDNRSVVSGGGDGSVRLWDARTGHQRWRTAESHEPVRSVAFSPDGTLVASGGDDKGVRLFDVVTGKERRRVEGHQTSVAAVAFTPDGKAIVSGSGSERSLDRIYSSTVTPGDRRGIEEFADASGSLRVWDVATGKSLGAWPTFKEGVRSLAVAPDGKTAALTGASGGPARVYDLVTGREVWRAQVYQGWAPSVGYADDGKTLLATGDGGAVLRLDAKTGKEKRGLAGHAATVSALAIASDGKTVATGSWDHAIRLWDAATGEERRLLTGHSGGVMSLAFSPDGALLASASEDRTVRLWDVATGKERRRFEGQDFVLAVGFSADGKAVVSAGNDKTLRVWDVAGGRLLRRHPTPCQTRISAAAVAPDGRRVAVVNLEGMPADTSTVRLFETATGKELPPLAVGKFGTGAVAFSPDGGLVATGDAGGAVGVWDPATGKQLHAFKDGGEVMAVAFSADGRALASVGSDRSVRLRELAGGGERYRFMGASRSYSLAFSADSRRLISGGFDTTALVWDATGSRGARPVAGRLEALWEDLRAEDAARAYRAVCDLAADPGPAVPFLLGRLRSLSDDEMARIDGLIRDLDSARFATRQQALARLEELGPVAVGRLRKALEGQPSAEVRRRTEELLAKADTPADAARLRALRAVEVLERAGTAAARRALGTVAERSAWPEAAEQARAALRRLSH